MACVMDVIIVFVVVGSVVSGQIKVEKDDNIEPFSILCRIYNVAKNPPINYVDLQEPAEIVKEINSLNASLVEPKLPNETEQMENSVGARLPQTATREAALAQLSLNQITQKAHKILDEIKKMKVNENIEKAKADFSQVIFGEGGNESNLCHATVSGMDNRSAVCGEPGAQKKGSHAGKNLVVDFFCLCAQRTDKEGANQVCGFYVGRISHYYGWDDKNGPWGSSTMWASIKGGCGKHMHQHTKSTAEARHILDQFLKHLKTGGIYRWGDNSQKTVDGSDRKEGMLGTGVGTKDSGSGPVCDGKEGKNGREGTVSAGVCVYYGPEKWQENIDWLKQLKAALVTVDYINNQTASIQRIIKKLQMLQDRAEKIYETTKVITEVQNTAGLVAFQNASGNITAYNATRTHTYSSSSHPCSIPKWVLFLL
ncbi:Variant surface glycoprotein [Trypanosoma congolense IL3000]|uniref:Variant surface glycoprotein n=1 Tax=Trypanosoma congolense (strain IL3000) TaxID=1068625 RepID=F9WCL1_TRYCI|nr:Variant surface glycoprotein [Trypanosoma congolense IL3000]